MGQFIHVQPTLKIPAPLACRCEKTPLRITIHVFQMSFICVKFLTSSYMKILQCVGNLSVSLNGGFSAPLTEGETNQNASERSMQFEFGWFGHPIFKVKMSFHKQKSA